MAFLMHFGCDAPEGAIDRLACVAARDLTDDPAQADLRAAALSDAVASGFALDWGAEAWAAGDDAILAPDCEFMVRSILLDPQVRPVFLSRECMHGLLMIDVFAGADTDPATDHTLPSGFPMMMLHEFAAAGRAPAAFVVNPLALRDMTGRAARWAKPEDLAGIGAAFAVVSSMLGDRTSAALGHAMAMAARVAQGEVGVLDRDALLAAGEAASGLGSDALAAVLREAARLAGEAGGVPPSVREAALAAMRQIWP